MSNLWRNAASQLARLSDHQRGELSKSLASPIGLLLGQPGTGKTFTFSELARWLVDRFGAASIRAAAPTGLAAQRMTQSLVRLGLDSIQATTIHRLLGVRRNGHDGQGWGFDRNEFNPLANRFLFLDEMSMCDIDLFASLMRACPAGIHVLLIGDIGQLPPIGGGCPLRDMKDSGVVPFGELTEIQRNSGDIILSLKSIREDRQPKPSQGIDVAGGRNWKHFECGSSVSSLARLSAMFASLPSGVDPIWDIQVICALNDKGDLNRETLNDRIQSIVNPRETILTRNKSAFKVGDKVRCTKNGYRGVADSWPEYSPPEDGAGGAADEQAVNTEEEFVANGELGEVVGLSSCGQWLGVRLRMSGKIVATKAFGKENSDGESAASPWVLAYALTCHGYQGSQCRFVISIIDDAAARIASKEYWTTGLSRAEELLITIGKLSTFHRQCRREVLSGRKTFLKERITGSGLREQIAMESA